MQGELDYRCRGFLENLFQEVEPRAFYADVFSGRLSNEDGTGGAYPIPLHGIIQCKENDKRRWINVWNSLDALEEVQSKEQTCAYMCPAAYIGRRRKNEYMRELYALTFDVDHLKPDGTGALFSQIQSGTLPLPMPTYTVWSGRGMHLYYCFEEPLRTFPNVLNSLQGYKTAVSRWLLNKYVTERNNLTGNQEIESVTQCMRVVGSGTRYGLDVARAYKTGDVVSPKYLDGFLGRSLKEFSICGSQSGWTREECAVLYPEWYEERILKGQERKYWTCNKALYDWWLKEIKDKAVFGHRYFAVMGLAVYAAKCDVPLETLETDALSLIPLLSERGDAFTVEDVRSALEAYQTSYKTFPRRWIETLSAIPIKENRRNNRKQSEHLILARHAKQLKKQAGAIKEGRPSKAAIVKEWREMHAKGTKAECIRETGLAKNTVYKHWEGGKGFQKRDTFTDLEDVKQYIQSVPEELRQAELLRITPEIKRISARIMGIMERFIE